MSDEMGLVPVAWRYISSAKGAKWTVQKNRPTNVEAWPEYTVEPLYDAAAIERLVAERDEARAKVCDMHRRAQKAEGRVTATIFTVDLWLKLSRPNEYLVRSILKDIRRCLLRRARQALGET